MTIQEIRQAVDAILVEGLEIDAALLKPEALLADDLGLDSLDGVDLVVAIEKTFAVRIEEADARSMRTLKDIYDHVAKRAQSARERSAP